MIDPLIGLGLRHPHYQYVMQNQPEIGWFEVHTENFLHKGGPTLQFIHAIAERYPLSLHGVGLSLGSAQDLCLEHLSRVKDLNQNLNPFLISEHLSWGAVGAYHLPDLLPIPYHQESLNLMAQHVQQVQEFLGRELLIENPSSYLTYTESDMQEVDFLVDLCEMTGAKILLDINNLFVSAHNHQWNAWQYLQTIPQEMVKEIHLAGHSLKKIDDEHFLRIDTHDHLICDEVWDLYDFAIQRLGRIPTLIEWDAQIPSFDVLMNEASKASRILHREPAYA